MQDLEAMVPLLGENNCPSLVLRVCASLNCFAFFACGGIKDPGPLASLDLFTALPKLHLAAWGPTPALNMHQVLFVDTHFATSALCA